MDLSILNPMNLVYGKPAPEQSYVGQAYSAVTGAVSRGRDVIISKIFTAQNACNAFDKVEDFFWNSHVALMASSFSTVVLTMARDYFRGTIADRSDASRLFSEAYTNASVVMFLGSSFLTIGVACQLGSHAVYHLREYRNGPTLWQRVTGSQPQRLNKAQLAALVVVTPLVGIVGLGGAAMSASQMSRETLMTVAFLAFSQLLRR